MGKYLPRGLKIALFGCLGAFCLRHCRLADTPSTTLHNAGCCRPNAKNWGYYETKWRHWPCDQRPEQSFPGGLGNEVLPPPAGREPLPCRRPRCSDQAGNARPRAGTTARRT